MSIEVNASKAYVRPYAVVDIALISASLRQADVSEIRASSGLNPLEALERSVALSTEVFIGTAERPFCIFGVAPHPDPDVGIVWMVGTDEVSKHRREFLRQCRDQLDRFHDRYLVLTNFVDERNTAHIAWLKWCGAVFIHRHPVFGHEGRPFLEFVHVRSRNNLNARHRSSRHRRSGEVSARRRQVSTKV